MRGIVYCGVNDWHSIKQRPQHLAEQLAATNHVLYVNPVNYSVYTHLLGKLQRAAQRPWRSRLESLDERLWLFTPAPALPFSRWFRLLNRLNQRWLALQLRPALRTLGFSSPWLWLSFPTQCDLIGLLEESRVIVDCLDDYSCFFNGRQQRVISRMEFDMILRGDWALATSQLLFDKCSRLNPRTHLITNGVEIEHFSRARRGLVPPGDLTAYPHPRFGYVGTIGPWLDIALLIELASACPEGSVIVIGPWEIPIPRDIPPNLHILGVKPYAQLPQYLAGCDVGLIPFKTSPLSQAVNPVKLFEYVAAGLPVVAIRSHELDRYARWCCLNDTREGFIAAAVHAARNQFIPVDLAELAEYDWRSITERILRLIGG